MNSRNGFAFILGIALLWFGLSATGAELDRSLSEARLAVLGQLTGAAFAASPEMSPGELVDAISAKFKATEACLSDGGRAPLVLEPESEAKAKEELAAAAKEVYPVYTMEQLRKKAAEIYPLYKVNQTVRVTYRKNARLRETVRGVYMGTRGGNVIVNSRSIRIGDMQGIEGNDGPEGEIAKFDQIVNQRYRQQWMDDYISSSAVSRKKYEDEHHQEYLDNQVAKDFQQNQRNGYSFWDEQWFTPDQLLEEYAAVAVSQARRQAAALENARVSRRNAEIAAQLSMSSQSYKVNPIGRLPQAEGVLAKQAEAERKQQELLAQQAKEEADTLEREAEEARQAELAAQRANSEDESAVRRPRPVPEVELEQPRSKLWLYVIVGAVLVGAAGFGAWLLFFRGEKELDVSEFYKSKGEFQENFWSTAEADPEGFKYVAYLFDTVDEAKEALCQLSFVGLDKDGNLKSKRGDIVLGAYSHQNRAVAVIGGVSLNYARWREASMVWPELPNAAYFRQSSEPKVKLVMPSAEELSRQDGLNVVKLSEEDVRTDTGEINRVFRYQCDNREDALKFLALFKVEEEGVVVRVETADGEFGKDINGVFTV